MYGLVKPKSRNAVNLGGGLGSSWEVEAYYSNLLEEASLFLWMYYAYALCSEQRAAFP